MRYVKAYKELNNFLPYALEDLENTTIEWRWLANCLNKMTSLYPVPDSTKSLQEHTMNRAYGLEIIDYRYCSSCLTYLKEDFDIEITKNSIEWTLYQTVLRLESDANKLIKKINSKSNTLKAEEAWNMLSQVSFISVMLDGLCTDIGPSADNFSKWSLSIEEQIKNVLLQKYPWEADEENYGMALDTLGIGLDIPQSAAASRWFSFYNAPDNAKVQVLQRIIIAPHEVLEKEQHDELVKIDKSIIDVSFVEAFMSLDYRISLADKVELAELVIKKL